jgi:hypothetical protein
MLKSIRFMKRIVILSIVMIGGVDVSFLTAVTKLTIHH